MSVRVTSSTARAFGVKGAKRAHKYGAVRVEVDGYKFDSKAEAKEYGALRMLECGGIITELKIHPRFPLIVKGVLVGAYTPDFTHRERGRLIVTEVKGVRKADYVLRAALFKALYPDAEFREVRA